MLRLVAALATTGALAVGVPTAAHAVSGGNHRQQLKSTGHVEITRDIQRGAVTAVTPTAITLKSKDGYTHTYAITDKTKVKLARQDASASDITTGMLAQVVAVDDQARRIMLRKKPA